jgi:hypothetical protein
MSVSPPALFAVFFFSFRALVAGVVGNHVSYVPDETGMPDCIWIAEADAPFCDLSWSLVYSGVLSRAHITLTR